MRSVSNTAGTSRAGASRNSDSDSDTSPARQRPGNRLEAPGGMPQPRASRLNMPSTSTTLHHTYTATAVGLIGTGVQQTMSGNPQGPQMMNIGGTMLLGRVMAYVAAPLFQQAVEAVRRMFDPQIDRNLLLGALNHITATSEDDPDDMTELTGRHTQQVVDHLADLADGSASRSVLNVAAQATNSRELVEMLLGLARGDNGRPVLSQRASSGSSDH